MTTSVLFTHYGNNWIRGSEQCLIDLVAHIDRANFTPTVICNQPVLADAIRAVGVAVDLLPDMTPTGVIAGRRQVKQLQQAAEKCGADLIHANTSVMVPALLPVARSLHIPLLAHLHIVPTADERKHLLLHQASLLVGVSRIAAAGFVEDGTDPRKVRVILNAVDERRISAGDATGLRASLGIPVSATTVGALGSLVHRKGHDVTIRAVAAARRAGTDIHLLLCGSGDEEESLRALVSSMGLNDYVHFLGFRNDAGAILRDAVDVLAASARDEALPLNVLEAQCLGVPVIASDIPAHHEALVDVQSSRIVPLEDVAALGTELGELAHDKQRAQVARTVTQPVARERYSMKRYVSDFEAAYRELLLRPRANYGWLGGSSWPRVYTAWGRQVVARRLGFKSAD